MSQKPEAIWVTNTLTGKKEKLETTEPGKLKMYSCGPTVYNLIHIGNLRGAVVSDLYFRFFKKKGYEVEYVRNYTDVDDKIINRAQEENTTPEGIAKKYTEEVERDFALTGLLEPTYKVKATEHIQDMIQTIQTILDRGYAYVTSDGEVLFSIQKFQEYGKLSHKDIEQLEAGARVEVSQKKHNPLDFTLWKPAKAGEPAWDSPWGKGRPGWHIECSTMAGKWLGHTIDVHHGGEDLIFPHHENEIAQAEAATGQKPFVRYWLHNAFLNVSKQKMAKSLGNVFTAREFLSHFSGEVARYMLLSAHYRSVLDFSEETIEHSLDQLERLYEAKQEATKLAQRKTAAPDQILESEWGEFAASCEQTTQEIHQALANDFNTPEAIAALFRLIREWNRLIQKPKAKNTPAGNLAARAFLKTLEQEFGEIFGVGLSKPDKMLDQLNQMRGEKAKLFEGKANLSREDIEKLIAERAQARKEKDFKTADTIRDDLYEKGIVLKDTPQGTTWSYR